jgi:type VI secretion system protein ImpF
MAEPAPKDRLQPALLDRLTDDEPGSRVESREKRVLSMARLRECVLRDLRWLLNTAPLSQGDDLSDLPQVRESVLDFGLPDLAGRTLSGVDPAALERTVLEAIRRFEPRILPQTLRVRAVMPEDPEHRNALAFEIEGDLWGQPLPTSLYLKSEIDLEDGSMSVAERSGSGPR